MLTGKIGHQTHDHADAGKAEAIMPAIDLADRTAQQRREKAADVDADIINIVRPGGPGVAGGIEVVDLARQARQEQAIAQRDRRQRDIEQRLERHHEVAGGHDRRAEDHRAPFAEQPVGDDTAHNRREIGAGDIDAVDVRRMRLADQQLLGHVVHEQGAHAEVGELLPHIGQEEDGESARLTKPGLLGHHGGGSHAAIIASAPQTLSSQNTMPSRYSTPGARSCLRNVGPSRSTMSHSCPSTKPGAMDCLGPTMLPTITPSPAPRAAAAIISASVRPPHLSSLMLNTSKRAATTPTSVSVCALSSAASGIGDLYPSRSASRPRASGCSISETFAACIAATKASRSAMPKPCLPSTPSHTSCRAARIAFTRAMSRSSSPVSLILIERAWA